MRVGMALSFARARDAAVEDLKLLEALEMQIHHLVGPPDSNKDQTGYEPAALPVELWAERGKCSADFGQSDKPPRGDGGTPSPGRPGGRGRRAAGRRASRLEEAPQLLRARGVLELPDRLGLDLADALAGDLEDPADLLERVGVAVAQAVAELDDLRARGRSGS